MADAKPLSISKVVAGIGGALLVASFFLPLASEQGREAARREMFGISGLRGQIEAQRDLEVVRPLIEPALQSIEAFTEMPSLRNLSTAAALSSELLDTAAGFAAAEAAEMRKAATMLSIGRMCLWWLPLVGAVQVLVPAVTLLRGYAGVLGLVARFAFGLFFMLIAAILLAGALSERPEFVGPALWVLLAGSLLMMGASLCGVTRANWWIVLLADLAIFAVAVVGLVSVAEKVSRW